MDQKRLLSIMGDRRTRRFEGSEWSDTGISEQASGFRTPRRGALLMHNLDIADLSEGC